MNLPPESPFEPGEERTTSVKPIDRLRELAGRLPANQVAAIILVLLGLSIVAFSLSSSNNPPLYPILPTPTPPYGTIEPDAQVVSFADLNADPASFQGKRIQVAGVYTPLSAPECLDYSGPIIRWSLVADELQLSASGFEDLLRLVEEGTLMTVTGTWRQYHGPEGCGKEPVDGIIWYLAVDRIIEPNPIQASFDPALTIIVGSPQPTIVLEGTIGGTTEGGNPPIEGTQEITATATIGITQSALPSQTPTSTLLPVTPLATPQTPNPIITGTPNSEGTPNQAATVSPTADATLGVGGTTTPTSPTTTPSGTGYPSLSTPTPTATTGSGYP